MEFDKIIGYKSLLVYIYILYMHCIYKVGMVYLNIYINIYLENMLHIFV